MKKILHFTTGVLVGAALFSGGTALAAGITASRSTQPIYVDGKQVSMTAYNIGGSNYIKLRDVGEAVGFNVYWDGTNVQVDSSSPYTGISPVTAPPTSQVTPSPASGQSSQDVDAMRQEIVDRTNAVRIANGQKALPTDPMLMQAAQVRAEEMAATYTFSHTRPDGTSRHTTTDCWTIVNKVDKQKMKRRLSQPDQGKGHHCGNGDERRYKSRKYTREGFA